MIVFDYRCINEDCPAHEIKEERIHKKDEIQLCSKCNEELQRLPAGQKGAHISWSTWRI
jgi:predicted SprT family Zn-dependent metalloprotease